MKNNKKTTHIHKKIPQFWKDRLINIGFTVMVLLIFLIVWIIIFYAIKKPSVVPSVSSVLIEMGHQIASGVFWKDMSLTLLRSFIAFIISIVLAVVVNLWGKIWYPIRKIFDPIAAILRTLPTMGMILLVLIWTPDYVAPVIVAFGVVFPNCYSQVKASVDTIDPNLITMAKVFNLSKKDTFYNIYFKQTQPYLLRCIGTDFSFSFKVMISAECMAATKSSLGELITEAKAASAVGKLAALIIMGVIIAVFIDLTLSQLVRITYKWNRKAE